MTRVKFCGLAREQDIRMAADLGAAFVGVVLTRSPRQVTPEAAAALLAAVADREVRTVGVFGSEPLADVIAMARIAGVDIVQLHGARAPDEFGAVRRALGVQTWRVVRVGAPGLTGMAGPGADVDATLLDTYTPGSLGGSGQTFDWGRLDAAELAVVRGTKPLIVAGGLRPDNVQALIDRLAPDVVDVSSGVESSPGVKDHALMTAFVAAAGATPSRLR
jgi:phosphoribosylanthranilate isomerase